MQALLGIPVFVGIAWLISENRKSFPYRLAIAAIVFQIIAALVLLKFEILRQAIASLNHVVFAIEKATAFGSQFMFGFLGGGPPPFEVSEPNNQFIIAFQILPIILVVSALSALLYHWKILPKIIGGISNLLRKSLKVDGVTAFGVASSIFLGIIETPILIRPYLSKISRSGLFTILTAAMATVAGTVMVLYASVLNSAIPNAIGHILVASIMSAPAAILFAKIIIPEKRTSSSNTKTPAVKSPYSTSFEAIVGGTTEGLTMVLNVAAMIIVLFSLVALTNIILGVFPFETPLTIESLLGYLLSPLCWLMGIPAPEMLEAGRLLAIKIIMNEFVAYLQLVQASPFHEKSRLILMYAFCGFANLGSLGILIGGLSPIIPDRKKELIELSFKALIAGMLATMSTGALIGLLS